MKKHLTASVYIVAKIGDKFKVLLHWHKKHQMWLGVGGHVEPDENPIEAALREAEEETGLKITLIRSKEKPIKTKYVSELIAPVTILEEKIPPYKDKPAHYHIDLIYFGLTKKPNSVKMEEKFGWFSEAELKNLKLAKEVRSLAKKSLNSL